MFVSSGLDSYNKTTRTAQGKPSFLSPFTSLGTLIQNWNEERTLREDLGEGRAPSKFHVTKKHDELFTKPVKELNNVYSQHTNPDQTFGRVFGRQQEPNYVSEQKDK